MGLGSGTSLKVGHATAAALVVVVTLQEGKTG
jgi:hypothetical protein